MLGEAIITDFECTDVMIWFLCKTANEVVMNRCLVNDVPRVAFEKWPQWFKVQDKRKFLQLLMLKGLCNLTAKKT